MREWEEWGKTLPFSVSKNDLTILDIYMLRRCHQEVECSRIWSLPFVMFHNFRKPK